MKVSTGWLQSAAVYRDRRMLVILFLGFVSGLPLALTLGTLSAWLATVGVDKTTIGLFALVGLPYTLKFLWSPFIDGVRVPVLGALLGRRRSWAIVTQVALMASVFALGTTEPGTQAALTAVIALAVAFFSASQDIVIDAYRVEILAGHEQGAGAAAIQIGYRIGMLVSGAGALYIADFFGWFAAFAVMAALVSVGMATILLNPEPTVGRETEAAADGAHGAHGARGAGMSEWIEAHVVAPFADFVARGDWPVILLFILLYKFGDAVAGIMANPFYIETGFTLSEIASVSKVFGLGATLAGAVLGGIMVVRLGVLKALLICGVLQMLSNLMFAVQAMVGHDIAVLALTVGIENFTGGMGTAAFVAYLSSLCTFAFTATQYALLSSLAAVGRTVLSAAGGWMADQVDWVSFFLLTTVAALPGLLLLIWLIRAAREAPPAPARTPTG
jgi:PAT family beta-lactamase induction signal transducer AmpG